nr:nucleoside/nucleotide kinase family protein [Kineosporia sp. NBRC 101731]
MRPTMDELSTRVLKLAAARMGDRVIVGIAGVPGAGKSTLAEKLVSVLADRIGPEHVAHVPMDGFHLADVTLERLGLRDRKGAPETFDALGYSALMHRLRESGDLVYAPGFERTIEQPIAGAIAVPPSARVVVTEGNYLLLGGDWDRAKEQLDEVWFCRTPEDLRLERLLARHVLFGKTPEFAAQWIEQTDQPNALLIEASSHRADLIVEMD